MTINISEEKFLSLIKNSTEKEIKFIIDLIINSEIKEDKTEKIIRTLAQILQPNYKKQIGTTGYFIAKEENKYIVLKHINVNYLGITYFATELTAQLVADVLNIIE